MRNKIIHQHIIYRLKIINLAGTALMMGIFLVTLILSKSNNHANYYAQALLLIMATLMAFGYAMLLPIKDKEPFCQKCLFVLLNLGTSALVWSTGILQSPFFILYVIILIVSTQLYGYATGLMHLVIALTGFVFAYEATSYGLLPILSFPALEAANIYGQPSVVIITYTLLYTILLFYTVMSASPAKIMLYQTRDKADLDMTYQEKIIQEMPIAVIVIDNELEILGSNPAAETSYPTHSSTSSLSNYFNLPEKELEKTLKKLSTTGKEENMYWQTDGHKKPARVSVRLVPGEKSKGDTYILFLDSTL